VVGNSGGRFIPACYDLLFDWLQPGERFDVKACGACLPVLRKKKNSRRKVKPRLPF
jgi:hypothetical protein